jgi:hypothetical protein
MPFRTRVTSANATLDSFNQTEIQCTADCTISLPPSADVPQGFSEMVYKSYSGGTVTVSPNGTDTIDGAASASITAQFSSMMLVLNGTDWQGTVVSP